MPFCLPIIQNIKLIKNKFTINVSTVKKTYRVFAYIEWLLLS